MERNPEQVLEPVPRRRGARARAPHLVPGDGQRPRRLGRVAARGRRRARPSLAPGARRAHPAARARSRRAEHVDTGSCSRSSACSSAALVAAYTSGRLKREVLKGPRIGNGARLALALLGGVLMGAAAKIDPRLHLGPGALGRRAPLGGRLGLHVLGLRRRLRARLVRPEGVAMTFPHLSRRTSSGSSSPSSSASASGSCSSAPASAARRSSPAQFYGYDMTVFKVMFSADRHRHARRRARLRRSGSPTSRRSPTTRPAARSSCR